MVFLISSFFSGAHRPGDHYLAGRGKTHGYKGQQVEDVSAGGNGAHAGPAYIIAHHNQIYEIVNRLQGIG